MLNYQRVCSEYGEKSWIFCGTCRGKSINVRSFLTEKAIENGDEIPMKRVSLPSWWLRCRSSPPKHEDSMGKIHVFYQQTRRKWWSDEAGISVKKMEEKHQLNKLYTYIPYTVTTFRYTVFSISGMVFLGPSSQLNIPNLVLSSYSNYICRYDMHFILRPGSLGLARPPYIQMSLPFSNQILRI